ncbi:MAG: aminoglycoside phosphotransferase family protein [Anaerolineae bacterium]|nr:aminoglycoside phosphotransferase family protein [Anaerolineae bacterium]
MEFNLSEIVKHFQLDGQFVDAKLYGFGHINDTYEVCLKNGADTMQHYVLQRINHHVFKDPEKVMHNVIAVIAHLRNKIIAEGGDPDRETLNIIPTANGKTLYRTEDGYYWRAYVFITGAQSYQVVENLTQVYHAGRAFGRFQYLLCDFPTDQLFETIPDFHHTRKRFDTFVEAVEKDVQNRARTVRSEIAFVEQRVHDTTVLIDLLEQGELPLRVTHNDTKFNNVMLDERTSEGVCVIDLDTVMPGLSLYDFGDFVRSAANPAMEDEPDVSKVYLDLEIFRHLTRGYMEEARSFLTPLEIDYLPFSAKLIALELGMRFLTDHLNGDTYFKVHRVNHNLDRCRTQFKLVCDIEENFQRMTEIVAQYI